jgi:diguanylate cyclase (GGDEF)-like protein
LKDVTERKRNEEALIRSANFDALTGLPNRVLLNDRIDHELVSAKRYQRSFGLLAIDLDNFKIVNDNLGHDAGDLLLCEARDRLLSCVRDNDTVSRIGGDEFLLLLSELFDQNDVDLLAQRVLQVMEMPFSIAGSEVFVGASIGAAIYPRDGASRSELLQHADIAMYRAKDQGRNNYQHYAEHMQTRFKVRMSMESQLRRALDQGEFLLHYQPQVEVSSGKVVGAEALIRWKSPTLGMVSPAQFIPLAEETGLIVPIGSWVIDRAMQDAKVWLELAGGADCKVAINLSARQFNQLDLMDVVSTGLQNYDLKGTCVELEITESLVMTSPQKAAQLLERWRELGCHIAIDDFGTGYSNLAYLRNFPVDCLKIDKTLIGDAAIVKAVVQLAHNFGMHTVAEGVEDQQTLNLLMQLKCDLIQGYYYSKPLPMEAFVKYLLAPQIAETGASISKYAEGNK